MPIRHIPEHLRHAYDAQKRSPKTCALIELAFSCIGISGVGVWRAGRRDMGIVFMLTVWWFTFVSCLSVVLLPFWILFLPIWVIGTTTYAAQCARESNRLLLLALENNDNSHDNSHGSLRD